MRENPIQYEQYNNDLVVANNARVEWKGERILTETFLTPAERFMEPYFNRDYRTIGDDWFKDLRYNFKTGIIYEGEKYDNDGLQDLFNRFVQETKDEKRISESIFVSDVSMVHQHYDGRRPYDRVRGTQYIRYTSGSNLPENVELNKWYKRDIDVELRNQSYDGNVITWEVAPATFNCISTLASYEEVKK